MPARVTPLPSQIADILRRSTSKHAQQSFPRFKINPRGVRLFVGQPSPSSRASRTEEKNGKSGSTNSAHVADAGFASSAAAAFAISGIASAINNTQAVCGHEQSWSSSFSLPVEGYAASHHAGTVAKINSRNGPTPDPSQG